MYIYSKNTTEEKFNVFLPIFKFIGSDFIWNKLLTSGNVNTFEMVSRALSERPDKLQLIKKYCLLVVKLYIYVVSIIILLPKIDANYMR